VARQAGLDPALARGGQTPQQKLAAVLELRRQGRTVAMVGAAAAVVVAD
jgi:cation transport ATPase